MRFEILSAILSFAATAAANPLPQTGPPTGTPGLEHEVCVRCDSGALKGDLYRCIDDMCCARDMPCELKCINDNYAACCKSRSSATYIPSV